MVAMNDIREHKEFGRFYYSLSSIFLCCFFFFYVWLRVNPKLIFHNQSPIFVVSWSFFINRTGELGGSLYYLAEMFAQLFYFPWLGALILTLVAMTVSLLTKIYLQNLTGQRIVTVHLIPLLFILALQNRYEHSLALNLGVLIGLASAVLYLRLRLDKPVVRFSTFVILSLILYYTTVAPYLLFACLAVISEVRKAKRPLLGALFVVITPFIPLIVSAFILDLFPADAYKRILPQEYDYRTPLSLLGLYASFPVIALALLFWHKALEAKARVESDKGVLSEDVEKRSSPESLHSKVLRNPMGKWAVQTFFIIFLALLCAFGSFERRIKRLVEIDLFATDGQWEEVLDRARYLSPESMTHFAWHDINRSLFHLQKLPYEMFSYPQSSEIHMFLPPEKLSETMHKCLKFSDLLYDLGLVNESEHLAYEALSSYGNHPLVLKRLILTNMLKGRIEAARVFLNLLEKYPLHRQWTGYYRSYINTGILDEPGLAHTHSIMLGTDHPGEPFAPETALNWLLEGNRRNRMAFEYLMAHYLLKGQFANILANIARLNDFDYQGIPTHYEEAILLYIQMTGDQYPNLRGRRIREETIERFREFNRLLAENINNMETALEVLSKDYEDTYWFYCAFSLGLLNPDYLKGS